VRTRDRLFGTRHAQRGGGLAITLFTMASWGPDVWSALGTVGAVVVALGIALSPPVWRWLCRPRLRFDLGETEPHVRPARSGGIEHTKMYLRLGVVNTGHLEARRVRAIVSDWWYLDAHLGPDGAKWIAQDLDPSILHWTGTAHVDQGRTSPGEISIPVGVRWFVDVCKHDLRSRQTHLILDDRIERGFRLEASQGLGDFRAQITLVAENATACTAVIGWRTSMEHWITDVYETDRPDAAPGGLLNILRR
jgi:hypothetical protein